MAAVFLHLPSLKSLGFDVRTDVSLLLTIFLLSTLARSLPLRADCHTVPCAPARRKSMLQHQRLPGKQLDSRIAACGAEI